MKPTPDSLPLRDIHLPEPITWWPLAPGWWLLLGLLIVGVLLVLFLKKRHYQRRFKRASLHELQKIRDRWQESQNLTQLVKAISALLRRTAISYYPRQNIAGLTDADWLRFLDATNAQKDDFSKGVGKVLRSAPYVKTVHDNEVDAQALLTLTERWLHQQPAMQEAEAFLEEETVNKSAAMPQQVAK